MAIHRQWTRLLTKTFDAHFLRSSNQYTCRVAPRNSFQQTIISNRCRSSSIFFRLSTGHVICGHENNGHKRQTILSGTVGLPENCCELREFSTDKNLPIIYLFTKEGCTLCDVAVEALKPHMHRFILKEVDITLPENEKWYEMYKYDIPVFHIYEEFLFKHRVDFDALERGLEKYKDGFDVSK